MVGKCLIGFYQFGKEQARQMPYRNSSELGDVGRKMSVGKCPIGLYVHAILNLGTRSRNPGGIRTEFMCNGTEWHYVLGHIHKHVFYDLFIIIVPYLIFIM